MLPFIFSFHLYEHTDTNATHLKMKTEATQKTCTEKLHLKIKQEIFLKCCGLKKKKNKQTSLWVTGGELQKQIFIHRCKNSFSFEMNKKKTSQLRPL